MKKKTKPKVFSGLLCANKNSFSVFSLFMVALLLCSVSLFGQQKNRKLISIDFKEITVIHALHEINRLGGNLVNFREEVVIKEKKKITVKLNNVTVLDAVKACLDSTGLVCSQMANGKILVTPKEADRSFKVSGKVVDEKGNPIAGATVVIHGTSQGVATDADGKYTLPVSPDDVLKVTFIGYKEEVVPIKGKTTVNIRLNPTAENLDEVTVVAFGEQKKESVVAAITTVNPESLKSSSSDLTTQFAGKIPGMIAWQTGGIPGALTEDEMNVKFYIRGITSFQSTANIDPLILLDGVESSKLDLARIAPEDIESFTVMKDASATAMYGARGANGVILVTTKKGEEGSVYTSARYELIASSPTREIDVVDPVIYMKMYNQALIGRNPLMTPEYSLERIERTGSPNYPSFVYPANNWYKTMFKDFSVNHHMGVNIRGGSKVIQYYASINYVRDVGMLKTDRLNDFDCNIKNNTFSFRTNLNIDLNAGIKLLITSSANLDKYHGPLKEVREAYELAFAASPVAFAPVYPADDYYNWPHIRFGSIGTTTNPYKALHQGYRERSRYSATVRAEYIHNLSSLVKGLEVRASMALYQTGYGDNPFKTDPFLYSLADYDFETGKHTLRALNQDTATRTLILEGANAAQSTQVAYELRALHTAAWGEHQTGLTGVFSMQESSGAPANGVLNGFPHRNMGLAMRGTYGYKDRYFLEASFGYNGSERFDKDHQWGFFPAVGMAWIASKENLIAGLTSKWLSFLKFRFSWGQVGNDGIIKEPRFTHLPTLGQQPTKDPRPNESNLNRTTIMSYPNRKIKWEVAEQMNLGVEAKFFKGVFEITADFYQEVRHNIIDHRLTIPSSVGLEYAQLANVGQARSRGIDLSGKIQHAFSKDLWVILNGTFTYSKAIYQKIEEATDKPDWQRKKNHEISQQIGYIAEGLFRDQAEIDNSPVQGGDLMPGDIRYRDLNGDGVVDVSDATYIGFPETPRLIYGFSGFVNYKGFEFTFSFQGSGKRGFFMDPTQINPFVDDRALLTEIYKDHWSEDNMKEKPFWPRLSTQSIIAHNPQENAYSGKEVRKSTYFMRECKFLRCTAIELGYNMPRNLITRLRLQNVKFYARVNNPFLISDFKVWDVELGNSGFNYPIQRTFSCGLNFSF